MHYRLYSIASLVFDTKKHKHAWKMHAVDASLESPILDPMVILFKLVPSFFLRIA